MSTAIDRAKEVGISREKEFPLPGPAGGPKRGRKFSRPEIQGFRRPTQ